MSQDKVASARMWFGELFQVGVYKRSQGRITRQVTFGATALLFVLMAWSLYATFGARLGLAWTYGLIGALLIVGLWFSYRLVNIPRFADFLIAVEAEMSKVSWPSKQELIRSSLVVIFVIFALSLVLFGFDLIWGGAFEWLGILQKSS